MSEKIRRHPDSVVNTYEPCMKPDDVGSWLELLKKDEENYRRSIEEKQTEKKEKQEVKMVRCENCIKVNFCRWTQEGEVTCDLYKEE